MSFSSFDFISPKITLTYNGYNSHVSRIGGFLSLCFCFLIFIIIFYYFWEIISPKYYTSFIYTDYSNNNKISQNLNYEGINHFIKIQSQLNDKLLRDIINKNILIYAIKENSKNIKYNNYLSFGPSNIEHWIYDKCDTISNINENLYSQISKNVNNYTSSICLRFYYNPESQKYYEIGNEGYIDPILETNNLNERRYSYKIIIQRCFNNTLINNSLDIICNTKNEINNYLNQYNEIFIYFSNNKILPLNTNKHFEKYFGSVSSLLHQSSYFENNIIFIPIKLIKRYGFISNRYKDIISYTFDSYYESEKLNNNENYNLLGIFNLYLNNNILTYEIFFVNILDILSNIGGLLKILFFIFQMFNYINHKFIIIKDTKNLFKINSGIESTVLPNIDKMRYITTKNFKTNQINTNEDLNKKDNVNFSPINKSKIRYYDSLVVSPKSKLSLKKTNNNNNNNIALHPMNKPINKKVFLSKENSFKEKPEDKRKSYLSQGFRVRLKDKDNNDYIKNQSYYENEASNNDLNSSSYNNNINEVNSNSFNPKENNNIKIETLNKYDIEYYPYKKNTNSKKNNFILTSNKYLLDKKDRKSRCFLNISNKELLAKHRLNQRHKSMNYNNQKKLNNIFNKNYGAPKISSEFFNDTSKQILINNKNILLPINHIHNKIYYNKNREIINNNIEMNLSSKNLNIQENIGNSNLDVLTLFKTIIKNKLKLEIPESQEELQQNIFKKQNFFELFKFLFSCKKMNENGLGLIYKFRLKLLSEEHLYRNHINLYLIQKLFDLEESYKFDVKELYSNL